MVGCSCGCYGGSRSSSSSDTTFWGNDGLTLGCSSTISDVARSSTSTTELTCTYSIHPNCHLPSSNALSPPRPRQEISPESDRRASLLWDGGWRPSEQTSERWITSAESTDSGTTDHRPSAICVAADPRPARHPPLRLILIKTVGTDNMWSSKPAVAADPDPSSEPPAAPRPAVTRPARELYGSLSESALSELSRLTELSYLRAGRDHVQHRNVNSPLFAVCSHAVFSFLSLP